jgi:fructosamine-3-kinase
VTGTDGGRVFTKRDPAAPPGFFAAEAWGLGWLAETGTVPVPAVASVDDQHISTIFVGGGHPSPAGAEQLGRRLADLHAAKAPCFGAPQAGFIGPLPLDNTAAAHWPTFYAEQRLRPYVAMAEDAGALTAGEARTLSKAVDRVAAERGAWTEEPPSRIHGDLWSGNVVWDTSGQGWLVDPAAHGGHRETDLAMLDLFGLAHLERLRSAYDAQRPLAPGWRDRVGLHQLHPLLVHAALFGPGYGRRATVVAESMLERS